MKKYKLFLGLNDKDLKQQLIDTETAINKVISIVGDCTISTAIGCYQGHKETSLIIDLASDDDVLPIIKKLNKEFNQECIYQEIYNCKAILVFDREELL